MDSISAKSSASRDRSLVLAKLFVKMLPVQVLTMAISCINNIVDGLVGSNFIGAEAMSTIGIYTPLQLACAAFNLILLGGSQVLCGRYMGAGRMDKTNGVYSMNLTVVGLFAAAISLLSFVVPGALAGMLGASAEARPEVAHYIIGRGIGVVPLLLSQQFSAFLQLERQNKRNYIGMGAMMVTNILLDLLFAAVLKAGVIGLGIATSLSNWIFAIVLGSYFFSKKASLRFSLRSIDWNDFLPLFKIGFPSAMLLLCNAARGIALNRMLATYVSMGAVAALATQTMMNNLYASLTTGIGGTTRMLASVSYGEDDRASVRQQMKSALRIGIVLTLIESVIVWFVAAPVTRLYYADASPIAAMTLDGLRACSFFLVPMMVANLFTYYYQAIDRNGVANLLSFLQGFLVITVLARVLIPAHGIHGVWTAMVVGQLLCIVFLLLYPLFYWKRLPRTRDEWLTLPPDFGAPDDQRLDLSIHSESDVSDVMKKVYDFCLRVGVDKLKAKNCALCLEEIAYNTIQHGFHADKQLIHAIDVRVVHRDEEIMLRLKDDCIPFNPTEWLAMHEKADPEQSMGLRLVSSIAHEIEYQNLLGLNVLTIRVRT